MLRKTGFEVLEAADGSSAIGIIEANASKIDAILLDMTIPGPSSREVAAEATKRRPDVNVILTSAYSQEMIADLMSAPQIRSFIRKPYEFEDLLQKLRNAFSSEECSLAEEILGDSGHSQKRHPKPPSLKDCSSSS